MTHDSKSLEEYLAYHQVHEIFKEFYSLLCYEQPENPLAFLVEHFQAVLDESATFEPGVPKVTDPQPDDDFLDDSDDLVAPDDMPVPIRRARRGGVSVAPMDPDKPLEYESIHKDEDTVEAINSAIKKIALFKSLDEKDFHTIIDAMAIETYGPGEVLIKQGEFGDVFFILGSGSVDIYVNKDHSDGFGVKVVSLNAPATFGELALMFGAPRAATVQASSECTCYTLNGDVYRHILMTASKRQRDLYETFLDQVPLFSALDKWERLTIADALESQFFQPGETIVSQGEPGKEFFIIEEGKCNVVKTTDEHPEGINVGYLEPKNFFGELALQYNQPRAASVIAETRVKVAKLDSHTFSRLLGPIEEILSRKRKTYANYVCID
eukprot:TRINITY_DN3115_c2_g1_i8.p1 TRINITY_DN3115_c2_g1~~TRINITY_DN3115_c2_g1_i8.p1  ORF type:complete len:392 (+),score=120.36 TRINITY_DN3115_c2_g1_i8:34-1176(+)